MSHDNLLDVFYLCNRNVDQCDQNIQTTGIIPKQLSWQQSSFPLITKLSSKAHVWKNKMNLGKTQDFLCSIHRLCWLLVYSHSAKGPATGLEKWLGYPFSRRRKNSQRWVVMGISCFIFPVLVPVPLRANTPRAKLTSVDWGVFKQKINWVSDFQANTMLAQ